MRHRIPQLLVALLLTASCRRTEPPVAERWSTAAPARRFPLGEVCDQPRDAASYVGDRDAAAAVRPEEQCGRGGRVSMLVFAHDAPRPQLPASAVLRSAPMGHVRAFVEGSRLSLDVDCEICRVDAHQLWIGDLDLMTEAQVVQFQRMAGFAEKPVLGDASAWRRALGS